ncbi:hypothetical protein [uncultured Reyranella sp.]|uniref:hypothetical protein n=1 Tax=uncultured Reyranella sp. TaxID=735512 RepID=UPI0025FA23D9|nr:hypothetical protein [uncultured Reyranella sp.]
MPTTIDRVAFNTAQAINSRIERATGERLRRCVGNPLSIERRLRELDREWDIERVLETNASVVAFLGLVLGTTVNRRWLLVPAAVTAFLFQHAVQGWCPPLPALRRMGVRTSREIEVERVALKILRGDFDAIPAPSGSRRRSDDAIRIARA